MNIGTLPGAKDARRFSLALAGLGATLISPLFWALTIDYSYLHRTGLIMWIVMIIGLIAAGMAARRDRRARTRVIAVMTGTWVLCLVAGYVFFTRLPPPSEVGPIDRVARLPLSDHLGQQVSLDALLHESAVLLTFYRGYW